MPSQAAAIKAGSSRSDREKLLHGPARAPGQISNSVCKRERERERGRGGEGEGGGTAGPRSKWEQQKQQSTWGRAFLTYDNDCPARRAPAGLGASRALAWAGARAFCTRPSVPPPPTSLGREQS